MVVSGHRALFPVPRLFPTPLGGHGHRRTIIGDLCERLTAVYVGGRRHKNDSTVTYCPDVSRTVAIGEIEVQEFFESKAAGRSNEIFIYAGRLDKDKVFAAAGNRLTYVVWRHGVRVNDYETVEDLCRAVATGLLSLYVIPFPAIAAACAGRPLEPLNSKYGRGHDSSKVYGSGYRLRLKLFERYRRG